MLKPMFTSLLAPHTKVTGDQLATEEGILSLGANLQALNRRRFFKTIAAAGAIAAVGSSLGGSNAVAQATMPTVTDVLNFALNLEFLEAEFYSYGFNGQSLAANVAASASGSASPVISGTAPTITASNVMNPPQVTLSGDQLNVVGGLLQDEAHHIALLQQTISSLSGTAITEATIDFSAGGTMPAITTNVAYFAATRQFTAVGNSAYAGAAADLISNLTVLQAAAQILGAEAQHLGVVNYLCATLGIVSPQLDTLDYPPSGTASIFTVTPIGSSTPAVGPSRTPQQVLGIVYGVTKATDTTPTAGVTKGGFFPNGVMGNITST